jgi:hypothetical protein
MKQGSMISRRGGWLSAWIGEELVMMSADSRAYLSLSGSGGRIWELLEEPRTLAGLCAALAAEYDAGSDQIRDEITAFLERLELQNAIELHPPAVA